MILVDANLLLYAYDSSSARHDAARRWLESVLGGTTPIGLAWTVLLAFLRIATNPRALQSPLSTSEAVKIVSEWLVHPQTLILSPGERHWSILADLVQSGQASGAFVMDAHLAALAMEHGAALCTTDRDFSRFSGLDFRNPLDH